jgi:uncharacterized protein (DUF302 family)
METTTSNYRMTRIVRRPFQETVQRVRDALAAEGFGVLSEIDVRATLKNKLGLDFPPYVILGACNPPLAHRALVTEPDIGVLLPCNVIVRSDETDHTTTVAAVDPEVSLARTGSAVLAPVAAEVKARLTRALAAVGK